MRLLIDGYNLMHVTDLFGTGDLEGTLRGSREALLDFLRAHLTERERKATMIVFDASQAIPGLPDAYQYEGIHVRFSRGYPDADTLLEEILEESNATKQLVVVSGDRRVQRAARSCGAKPIDSSRWFSDLRSRAMATDSAVDKPASSVEGNQHWVDKFSDPILLDEIIQQQELQKHQAAELAPPLSKSSKKSKRSNSKKDDSKKADRSDSLPNDKQDKNSFGKGIFDPFPPGYGEDLLE